MALIKEYFELSEKYIAEYGKKTIVLMQVGAFFEVYGVKNDKTQEITGSDILNFSRICDLNIADKKQCIGKDGVIMAGFSHYMIEKYLKGKVSRTDLEKRMFEVSLQGEYNKYFKTRVDSLLIPKTEESTEN